ncbi:growth/differentiation factor 9 [Gastrophryne carolinensis]
MLEILHEETADPVCSPLFYTFDFHLQRKQKWIEIDVTSFLQPVVASRQNIHLLFNMTCKRNKMHYSFGIERPIKITRSPPCLLLYLNDTSNRAYHIKKSKSDTPSWDQNESMISYLSSLTETLQISKGPRSRRGHDAKADGTAVEFIPYNFTELANEYEYHQNECELHRFGLSFSQLNWDKWILAPHRYSPDYCKGECPRVVGHRYGSPVHTIVQNIIYEKLDSSIPRPSCVPSEYRPMSVLTIEPDNSIAYKEYQDMIATQCTCR